MTKEDINKTAKELKKLVDGMGDNINKLEITAEKIQSSKNLGEFYSSILMEVLFKLKYNEYITREEFLTIFTENFKEHNVEESIKNIIKEWMEERLKMDKLDLGADLLKERFDYAIELVQEMCAKHKLELTDAEIMKNARTISISLYIARENYNRNKRWRIDEK